MSMDSGAISHEVFVVHVDAERFYHALPQIQLRGTSTTCW